LEERRLEAERHKLVGREINELEKEGKKAPEERKGKAINNA